METETTTQPNSKPMHPNHVLAISILLAAVIVSGSLLYTMDKPASDGAAQIGQENNQQQQTQVIKTQVINMEVSPDEHILGDEDAPVTIVEFSDFQCPFCRRFYQDSYEQIKENYVDTGKARIVYRHLPLSFHPAAGISAEASECAAEQDLFWEMHDKIFEEQIPLGNGTVGYGEAELKRWALEIGIDAEQFNQCLDDRKYAQIVAAHLDMASSLGATGTPTFFINGQRVVGAQPYSVFQRVIESEL